DGHVDMAVRIPMLPARRSLDLANSASIAIYEAWRQHGYAGARTRVELSASALPQRTTITAKVVTIAGSDVPGGAGLEAGPKLLGEYGAFGTAVVTCIVTFDPNDRFAHVVEFIDPEVVTRQLESTLAVHRFDTIKSGMLGSVGSALVLAEKLATNELPYV